MKALKESLLSDIETTIKSGDNLINAKLLFDTLTALTKKNYVNYKDANDHLVQHVWDRKQRFANTDMLGKTIKKGDLVLALRDIPIHEDYCNYAYGIVTDIKNGKYAVLCAISARKYKELGLQKHYDDSTLTMNMVKNASIGLIFNGWELIRIAGKNQFEAALNKIKM